MKLAPAELPKALAAELKSIYLVLGEEPLAVLEAADNVRAAAHRGGFDERLPLFVEPGFDWGNLAVAGASPSLFGGRRLIDLKLPAGKTDMAGSRALVEYAAAPAPDTLLLVTAPGTDRKTAGSAWAKALAAAGVLVECRPLSAAQLPRWIGARLRARKIDAPAEAPALIAEYAQGNPLAAAQAIERLALLISNERASLDLVREAVVDEARYGLFEFIDTAVSGKSSDALRMLVRLRETGTEPPLVLWAIARELRLLESWCWAAEHGGKPPALWASRRALVAAAARRRDARGWQALLVAAAETDRMIKGRLRGDPWVAIERLVLALTAPTHAVAA